MLRCLAWGYWQHCWWEANTNLHVNKESAERYYRNHWTRAKYILQCCIYRHSFMDVLVLVFQRMSVFCQHIKAALFLAWWTLCFELKTALKQLMDEQEFWLSFKSFIKKNAQNSLVSASAFGVLDFWPDKTGHLRMSRWALRKQIIVSHEIRLCQNVFLNLINCGP